jgi:hypothetical protein
VPSESAISPGRIRISFLNIGVASRMRWLTPTRSGVAALRQRPAVRSLVRLFDSIRSGKHVAAYLARRLAEGDVEWKRS